MSTFVYLASQSPRRSQLLTQLAVRHELLLPMPDEDVESLEQAWPHEPAKAYVQRVTRLKLQAAMNRLSERKLIPAPVICADTTVAIGRTILGKPVDRDDAMRMLRLLSGKKHRVLTAIAIGYAANMVTACSESWVTFATLSESEIRRYADSGEPMGKAGAYAIQGLAAAHIVRIQGSYTGIVGLPLYETAELLKAVS
jgi:septum formation protein